MQNGNKDYEKKSIHISIDTLFDDLFETQELERLRRGFDYQYSSNSLLDDLLQHVSCFMYQPMKLASCHESFESYYDEFAKDRFLFHTPDLDRCFLNANFCTDRFINNNGLSGNLTLFFIPLGGGKGIDEQNGIKFFVHSDESNHTPHIHARYQGEEISINIRTLAVKGSFKNMKKQKEALKYVKDNKEKLISDFKKSTNGIDIREFYLVDERVC